MHSSWLHYRTAMTFQHIWKGKSFPSPSLSFNLNGFTHLHKESKRFSILLFQDSELHTSWKEAEQRNQVQAREKPMLFAVQLCWLSTDFLELEFSTFLDLWTLTHFQQETQILSKMVLRVMTKDVFLLAPLKPALWLPGLKCSPEESTKPRISQPALMMTGSAVISLCSQTSIRMGTSGNRRQRSPLIFTHGGYGMSANLSD